VVYKFAQFLFGVAVIHVGQHLLQSRLELPRLYSISNAFQAGQNPVVSLHLGDHSFQSLASALQPLQSTAHLITLHLLAFSVPCPRPLQPRWFPTGRETCLSRYSVRLAASNQSQGLGRTFPWCLAALAHPLAPPRSFAEEHPCVFRRLRRGRVFRCNF